MPKHWSRPGSRSSRRERGWRSISREEDDAVVADRLETDGDVQSLRRHGFFFVREEDRAAHPAIAWINGISTPDVQSSVGMPRHSDHWQLVPQLLSRTPASYGQVSASASYPLRLRPPPSAPFFVHRHDCPPALVHSATNTLPFTVIVALQLAVAPPDVVIAPQEGFAPASAQYAALVESPLF